MYKTCNQNRWVELDNTRLYVSYRIAIPGTKKYFVKGKRVSYKRCPITREEHRALIEVSAVRCIKMIKDRLECDLFIAYELYKFAKNGAW